MTTDTALAMFLLALAAGLVWLAAMMAVAAAIGHAHDAWTPSAQSHPTDEDHPHV